MTVVGRICRCGDIVMPGVQHDCAAMLEHAQADSRRRQARGRAHRRTTVAWQRLRLEVLERDDWTCQLAVDDLCLSDATTVHLSPELGGDHDAATIDDCVSACAHCHGVVDGGRARQGGWVASSSSSTRPAPSPPRVLATAAVTRRGNA